MCARERRKYDETCCNRRWWKRHTEPDIIHVYVSIRPTRTRWTVLTIRLRHRWPLIVSRSMLYEYNRILNYFKTITIDVFIHASVSNTRHHLDLLQPYRFKNKPFYLWLHDHSFEMSFWKCGRVDVYTPDSSDLSVFEKWVRLLPSYNTRPENRKNTVLYIPNFYRIVDKFNFFLILTTVLITVIRKTTVQCRFYAMH